MKPGFWKNAFAVETADEAEFTDAERDLARRVARKIVDRGLGLPGLLFIESARPLNFVGSQALAYFEPIVRGLVDWDDYTRFRVMLERRGSVELLLGAIETAEAERADEISRARRDKEPGWFTRRWREWRGRKTTT
ncbi:MAG: hypothetical protein KJ042_09995 [Deltaproteobacteria bacterium]|nr:hypothetical protein [Deltaproteobacteria bacterium]